MQNKLYCILIFTVYVLCCRFNLCFVSLIKAEKIESVSLAQLIRQINELINKTNYSHNLEKIN